MSLRSCLAASNLALVSFKSSLAVSSAVVEISNASLATFKSWLASANSWVLIDNSSLVVLNSPFTISNSSLASVNVFLMFSKFAFAESNASLLSCNSFLKFCNALAAWVAEDDREEEVAVFAVLLLILPLIIVARLLEPSLNTNVPSALIFNWILSLWGIFVSASPSIFFKIIKAGFTADSIERFCPSEFTELIVIELLFKSWRVIQ